MIVGLHCVRPGVMAGKAAGMEVVAVPSIPNQSHIFNSADEVINSLLDLRPELWGLPSFQDCKPLRYFLSYSQTFPSKVLLVLLIFI